MRRDMYCRACSVRKESLLEKNIIQGYVHRRRSVGRQNRRWTEYIAEWTGLKINEAVRITEDRQGCHDVLLIANHLEGRPRTTTVCILLILLTRVRHCRKCA